MKSSDSKEIQARQNKENKPQDNVLTQDQTPSVTFAITGLVLLALNLFVAAIYFGIINP